MTCHRAVEALLVCVYHLCPKNFVVEIFTILTIQFKPAQYRHIDRFTSASSSVYDTVHLTLRTSKKNENFHTENIHS